MNAVCSQVVYATTVNAYQAMALSPAGAPQDILGSDVKLTNGLAGAILVFMVENVQMN